MTAVRFQIVDPSGKVTVDDGMLSCPERTTTEADARRIADGLASATDCPPGAMVRLWVDVDLIVPLASLGEPDAVAVTL